MRSRLIVSAVIAFLLIGTTAFGEDSSSVARVSISDSVTGFQLGRCGGGYKILVDWVFQLNIMDRYDTDGNLQQELSVYRVLGESLYYNSKDPAKALAGGPGEVEIAKYDLATGVIEVSGMSWKVQVPGYGLIYAATGTFAAQCDPYTFENCVVLRNTGHNPFADGDFAALCAYLK